MMQLATGFNTYDLYYCRHPCKYYQVLVLIVINHLLLWIGKRNSGPLQNVTQILSSMKSSIYSMLTLRKLLLEDADAESECCSFLERSSNKNSSWGAWSCTIVVSFTANTETKQKKNRKDTIHARQVSKHFCGWEQCNKNMPSRIWNCLQFFMISVHQINKRVWPWGVDALSCNKI